MSNTIGARIVLEGEKEYRQALKEITANQKELRSEMKLCSSEFDGQQNSLAALTRKHEILEKQIETQGRKVTLYTQRLEESQKAHEQAGQKVESLKAQLQTAEQEMDRLKNTTGTSAQALEQQEKTVENLKRALQGAEDDYVATGTALTNWSTSINNANADLNKMNSDLQRTEQYMEEARNSTDGCATSIDGYGRKISASRLATEKLGEQVEQTGDKVETAANTMASAFAAAGVQQAVSEIKEKLLECRDAAEQFETGMAKVSTIADTSAVPLETLSNDVIKVSSDLGVAATDIADAAYNAISAGQKTADAVQFAGTSTKLAIGGFTEASTAVDILTTTLNAYNLEADQAEHVSDMLITTQNLGKTVVADLATNMGRVIPVAAAYNVQMDNLSSAYAVMTANGIATSETTTYLKAMLNELGDTGSTVGGILEEQTGKNFAALTKEGKSLGDVIDILGKSVDNDATKFNALWSSSEAGVGALSLLNSGAEKYNSALYQMQNSSGATEKAFGTMADTGEMASKRMQNSLENLKISIGKSLEPAMKDLYEAGDDVFSLAEDYVDENPEVVQALTALTIGVGAFATAVTVATAAMEAWKVIETLVNPTTALVSAMGGLVIAAGAYAALESSVKTETQEMVASTREAIDTVNESAKARRDNTASNDAEISTIRSLTEELNALNSKENLSTQEKNHMRMVVMQLNDALPQLNLTIDDQTGKLSENAKGWYDTAEAMTAALEQEYKQKDLEEVYGEAFEAKKQLTKVTEELADVQAELAAAQEDYNEVTENGTKQIEDAKEVYTSSGESLWDLVNRMHELTEAQNDLIPQQEELQKQADDLGKEYEDLNEAMHAANETAEESGDYILEYAGNTYTIKEATEETRQSIEELQTAYQDAKSEAEDSINQQVSLFEELEVKSDLSVQQMSENLKSQTEAFTQYKDDLLYCADLVEQGILDEGLLAAIQSLGMDGAGYMHELATASQDDMGQVVQSFEEMQTAKDNLAGAIADINTDYSDQMDKLLGIQTEKQDTYKTNVEDNKKEVQDIVAGSTQALVDTEAAAMDDLNAEIVTAQAAVGQSMTELCTTMTDTATTQLNIVKGKSLVFQEIGRTLPAGLAQGINNGTSEVEKAIANMIDRMTNQAIAKINEAKKKIDRALGNALR